MKILRNIFVLLALAVILMLAFANADSVRLTAFGYHTPELPLFLYLVGAFILGFMVAALTGAVRQSGLRRQINRLERENASLRSSSQEEANRPPSPGSSLPPNH